MTSITFHAGATAVAAYTATARRLLLRFVAVNGEARIHRARLQAELYRNRYRLRVKN